MLGAVHLKASHLVIMALMGGPRERQRRIDRQGAKEGQNLLELMSGTGVIPPNDHAKET